MGKRLQNRQVVVIATFVVIAFLGLIFRLFDVQVLRHSDLKVLARENTLREVIREPRRGDILDAKGQVLATSVFVKTVVAHPPLIGPYNREVAHAIAPLLDLNEAWLAAKLAEDRKGVAIKKRVLPEKWQEVRNAMSKLDLGVNEKELPKADQEFIATLRKAAIGVEQFDDQMRVYPGQTLAAHVLGQVGTTQAKMGNRVVNQTVGKDGLELVLNAKLRGSPGWLSTERDKRGREITTNREEDVSPQDGLNAVVTIDSVVQHIVESALEDCMATHKPLSVSGIVVRPSTGEILAMATLPTFNPNSPGDSPEEAWRNRAVLDMEEPGSTFKSIIVAGALHDGTVRLSDGFDCENGYWFFAGHPLRDTHSYGLLSVEGIIAKSSNIGAAKIGIKMGAPRVYSWMRAFGFGTRTGIPLPYESPGIVRDLKDWSKVSVSRMPIGQGVAVTRLQMTMAINAIANKGRLMRPMLIDRLEDHQKRVVAKYAPQVVRQVISEEAARQITVALKRVVSTNGTAPVAALANYTVAGKTGTAQKVENGKYVRKYLSSFIGFLPAEQPELCIGIFVDDPPSRVTYYGSQVSAPTFKAIAEQCASYLNIRPDISPDPSENQAPPKPSLARTP